MLRVRDLCREGVCLSYSKDAKTRRNRKHVLRVGRCVERVALELRSNLLMVVDLAIDNHGGASRLIWGEGNGREWLIGGSRWGVGGEGMGREW